MNDNKVHTIYKDDYPGTLMNMPGSPRKLYYRGSFPAPKGYRYLCVVGSRKWTSYGRDAVYRILGGLKGYPISIVSGLAIGIDSMSHMAALEAGLHCIAFPGSNLDWENIYPREHVRLARMIVENGGALVSRWPSDYHTEKWAFPARNTLMAGLAHATLIIEAGKRSGSLMTAKHAEEYSRDVFAVPGPITASQSYGPHMLIREGAALISSSTDLLKALGFDPSGTEDRIRKIKSLDKLSASIMNIVTREEIDVSRLLEKTHSSVSNINESLTILELEGLIKINDGLVKIA